MEELLPKWFRTAIQILISRANLAMQTKQVNLSTGQKINGVEESLGIEIDIKDEVTHEIKTNFREIG
jgi:hypothetical protein